MSAPHTLRLALAVALAVTGPALAKGGVEPNTLVAEGQVRYVAAAFPDRIVASPAQDAATGFSVAWRTAPGVDAPVLEIAPATDSPDIVDRRRIISRSAAGGTGRSPASASQRDAAARMRARWRTRSARTPIVRSATSTLRPSTTRAPR